MLLDNKLACSSYLKELVDRGTITVEKGLAMNDRIGSMNIESLNNLHQALIMKEFASSKVIDEIKHAVLLAKTKGELNCFLDLTRSNNPMLTKVQVDTFIYINNILGN